MNFASAFCKIENISENMRANNAARFEKAFQKNREGICARHISTINEGMSGKSINGVKFARQIFTVNGEKVEGVFPVFKSQFTCKLPEHLYNASDIEQMKYCTKTLAAHIERDPQFAQSFSQRQLEQIKNGEPRISGLTWHHNERPGRMQLVNAADHTAARHTGGRNIWGGGSENR